jgi:hypothetical protein
LLLAALNRAACPTSKVQLAAWYRRTILPRLIPASAAQLSSQAFWNHMDRVSQADVDAIEKQLSARLVQRFQLNLRTLVYDGTDQHPDLLRIPLAQLRLLRGPRLEGVSAYRTRQPGQRDPRTATCLSGLAEQAQRVFDALRLGRYQAA